MRKLVLLSLALILWAGLAASDAVILGQPFPDLTVTDAQGNKLPLSAWLAEIPEDIATRVMPVSAVTAICVENEDALPITLWVEGEPQPVYVISGDTACPRLEAAAADNPFSMICFDQTLSTCAALTTLRDPRRGVYVYEAPLSGAEEAAHYTCVCLLGGGPDRVSLLYGVYLVRGGEYVEELMEDLRARGYEITWEYADAAPAESDPPQAYVVRVVDQEGAAVPGVYVNFCTDTLCSTARSDGSGIITFDGAPDAYHVQLLRVPEGYSFDAGFELHLDRAYGEWLLRIRRD